MALGNGDGTFQGPSDIVASSPSTGFSGIAAGDINNDGWPDLVMTNNAVPYNDVFVLLNNQQGGFTQMPTDFGALTTAPILVDVNGDGNLDLVVQDTASGGASIYLGNRTGTFEYSQLLGSPLGIVGSILAADVNGDGIPDVCVSGGDTLAIYLGEGDAKYATPFDIGTGPSPSNLLVENLHGQSASAGLPDIVEPDGSGGVIVLLNLTK